MLLSLAWVEFPRMISPASNSSAAESTVTASTFFIKALTLDFRSGGAFAMHALASMVVSAPPAMHRIACSVASAMASAPEPTSCDELSLAIEFRNFELEAI